MEILGPVMLGRRPLGGEIIKTAVGQEVAAERAPHMVMGVDQAGHHDHVRGVDDLGIRRREIGADLLDHAVADEDVRFGQGSLSGIDGDDGATLDQIDAARAPSPIIRHLKILRALPRVG